MYIANDALTNIPLIDVRNSSLVNLLDNNREKAQKIVAASKTTFGVYSKMASYVVLPVGDHLSRKWLYKTKNPYLGEIEKYASLLPIKGIFALNLCYEWGCTSGAYAHDKGVKLIRVLDWPFPALGENLVVAHQSGIAGDFYNMTWPGVSGVFQAVAPQRFAAALNQAPMRRHKTGLVVDWIRNRGYVHNYDGLPPAHLLRKTFETAKNYHDAKAMLVNEPVSIPVIYTLTGLNSDEGCVIERLETSVRVRELSSHGQNDRQVHRNVSAANHFETSLNGIGHGWMPRATDSYGRANCANMLSSENISGDFSWFKAPIANPLSRLAMVADAHSGKFSIMGTDGAKPVTNILSV